MGDRDRWAALRVLAERRPAATGLRRWLSTPPEPTPRLQPSRAWLLVIPAAFSAALAGCWLYGTPSKLPGVALGLPLLLNLERAAGVLATIAAVLIFAYLTSRGLLPTAFGNVSYPDGARQHQIEEHIAELDDRVQRRLEPLEQGTKTANAALPLIEQKLKQLDARLRDVETGH